MTVETQAVGSGNGVTSKPKTQKEAVYDLVSGGMRQAAVARRLGLKIGVVTGLVYRMRQEGLLPPSSRPCQVVTKAPVPPPSAAPVAGVMVGKMERMTIQVATCPKCGLRFEAKER